MSDALHPAAAELVAALVAKDDERPRTQQVAPGFSSLGDCRRKVWHMIREDAPCNADVERLPSILGTAIHTALEASSLPGFQEVKLYLPEIGMEGTADRINDGVLDDYKTTSLKNVEWVKDNGPSRQQRWQVQTYAHAWNGTTRTAIFDREDPVHTVRLIYIPRDGKSTDIHVHEEPYDPAVARDAIEWYQRIAETVHTWGPAPEPEKEKGFCSKYCQFFGELCPGLSKDDVDMDVDQDDPWAASAAETYARGAALVKQGDALKKQAAGVLEGSQGRYGNYRVTWVHRSASEVPDADEARRILAEMGREMPMKKKTGSSYPRVTAVKAQECADADG